MLASIAEDIPTDGEHLLNHRVIRLTPAQAAALRDHLDTVVEQLQPAGIPESDYGVVVAVYPKAALSVADDDPFRHKEERLLADRLGSADDVPTPSGS
jgi:hypothetical protein